MNKKLDTVKLSRLKKIIDLLEKHNENSEDIDVAFEYVIASCFPRAWNNIQKRLSYEHTQGYIQGREDAENEIKRNS
jgi:hypothetical protein